MLFFKKFLFLLQKKNVDFYFLLACRFRMKNDLHLQLVLSTVFIFSIINILVIIYDDDLSSSIRRTIYTIYYR